LIQYFFVLILSFHREEATQIFLQEGVKNLVHFPRINSAKPYASLPFLLHHMNGVVIFDFMHFVS